MLAIQAEFSDQVAKHADASGLSVTEVEDILTDVIEQHGDGGTPEQFDALFGRAIRRRMESKKRESR